MIRSISGSANMDEEAKDGMDEVKDEMDEAKDEMDEAEDGMDDRGLSTLSSYLCITPADARVEVA
jgi:hypothetical protein